MKVTPVASPAAVHQPQSNAQAAKARAVAAFTQASAPAAPQTEQPIVQNQNSIQPEELGAIQATERQESNSETTAEETTEVETPVEEAKPTEDPALSRQFAQLARQEKALRARAQQQDQALKAREAALQAREAELNKSQPIDTSKYISRDQFRSDPLSALAEAGVSYEELTQQIVSQQPVDPRLRNQVNELKAQIEELKAANENSKKSQAESQTQQYQAAVKQITSDATALVNRDTNFETIKATNSVRDVVELIEQTYAKDGVLLTVEEAAQQVEDYLVEEGIKIAKLQKIQRKLQPVAPKVASTTAQTPAAAPKQPLPMKTLTNNTSSTRQLSAKERAILAFKGELKS